jgi:hypothetical protein
VPKPSTVFDLLGRKEYDPTNADRVVLESTVAVEKRVRGTIDSAQDPNDRMGHSFIP